MNATRYIKAREILEAIEFAKAQNPKDKLGLNAVQVDVANQQSRGTVTYIPVKVNILNGVGADGKPKREWLDLHLMFRKANTRSNITPYDDRILQENKSVTLQFRNSTKSFWVNPKTKVEEEDPIGEVLDKLDSIIQAKILLHLKTDNEAKKINHDNQKINMYVQRGMKDPKTKKITKEFEDPIIRVEVKFRAKEKGAPILPSALPWQCTIHDANKPRSKAKTPNGEPPYEYASIDSGEGTIEEKINFRNIHKFITAGSSVTGYINASQISLSSFGISLTPRFTSLIVKKSVGFQADYTAMEGQLDDLGDAHIENYTDRDAEGESSSTGANKYSSAKSSDFAGDADEFGDSDDDLNAGVTEADLPDVPIAPVAKKGKSAAATSTPAAPTAQAAPAAPTMDDDDLGDDL